MSYQYSQYRVVAADLMRPDLISYKTYGTVRYWWIICLVNGIQNPLSDFVVGNVLKIPNILDIYDFYKRWSIR